MEQNFFLFKKNKIESKWTKNWVRLRRRRRSEKNNKDIVHCWHCCRRLSHSRLILLFFTSRMCVHVCVKHFKQRSLRENSERQWLWHPARNWKFKRCWVNKHKMHNAVPQRQENSNKAKKITEEWSRNRNLYRYV